MIKNLEKLGFTPNESAVYSALFELGETPTGSVIKKTGLHRNIVYESLDSLVKKKVVAEITKSNKKHFRVKDPQILVDEAQNKLSLTQDVVKQIQTGFKIIPHEVIIYEDQEGWQEGWRILMNQLKPKSIFYTIGMGGDRWVELMGDFYLIYEQYAIKNKITDIVIAYEHQRQEIAEHQSKVIRNIRYLPANYDTPVAIEILNDRIFMEIYEEPATLIEVRSKAVARGYKQYFDSFWKIAKT